MSLKKLIQQIGGNKGWFFEQINKIDKPLRRFIERERPNKYHKYLKRDVTADTTEIQRIMRKYYNGYMPTDVQSGRHG